MGKLNYTDPLSVCPLYRVFYRFFILVKLALAFLRSYSLNSNVENPRLVWHDFTLLIAIVVLVYIYEFIASARRRMEDTEFLILWKGILIQQLSVGVRLYVSFQSFITFKRNKRPLSVTPQVEKVQFLRMLIFNFFYFIFSSLSHSQYTLKKFLFSFVSYSNS